MKRTKRTKQPTLRRRVLASIGVMLGAAALAGVVAAGYLADSRDGGATTAFEGAAASDGRSAEPSGGPLVKLASWSGGGAVNLANPGKPTVVLAMAGWCSTCLPPARDLTTIHEEFGDRVQVIAVSVDPGETEATLRRFREAAGDPGYLWGFDSEGTVAYSFALRYLDTVIVLDEVGQQLHKSVRPSPGELREVLARALGEPR